MKMAQMQVDGEDYQHRTVLERIKEFEERMDKNNVEAQQTEHVYKKPSVIDFDGCYRNRVKDRIKIFELENPHFCSRGNSFKSRKSQSKAIQYEKKSRKRSLPARVSKCRTVKQTESCGDVKPDCSMKLKDMPKSPKDDKDPGQDASNDHKNAIMDSDSNKSPNDLLDEERAYISSCPTPHQHVHHREDSDSKDVIVSTQSAPPEDENYKVNADDRGNESYNNKYHTSLKGGSLNDVNPSNDNEVDSLENSNNNCDECKASKRKKEGCEQSIPEINSRKRLSDPKETDECDILGEPCIKIKADTADVSFTLLNPTNAETSATTLKVPSISFESNISPVCHKTDEDDSQKVTNPLNDNEVESLENGNNNSDECKAFKRKKEGCEQSFPKINSRKRLSDPNETYECDIQDEPRVKIKIDTADVSVTSINSSIAETGATVVKLLFNSFESNNSALCHTADEDDSLKVTNPLNDNEIEPLENSNNNCDEYKPTKSELDGKLKKKRPSSDESLPDPNEIEEYGIPVVQRMDESLTFPKSSNGETDATALKIAFNKLEPNKSQLHHGGHLSDNNWPVCQTTDEHSGEEDSDGVRSPHEVDDEVQNVPISTNTARRNGIHLIFVNDDFGDTGLSRRKGSEIDTESQKKLFESLAFRVVIYQNLNYEQTMNALKEAADKNYSVYMFFCTISSHGKDCGIFTTDGRLIQLSEFFAKFESRSCPTLQGTPKVFIIQTCLGSKDLLPAATDASETHEPISASSHGVHTPSERDFYIMYATLPGHVAYRMEGGSPFIRVLVERIRRYAEGPVQRPLQKIREEVSAELSRGFDVPTSSDDCGSTTRQQMCWEVNMVDSPIYLRK